MNFPQFKIRCSAIGQIMTNDRSGKAMGKTSMGYCEQWVKEQLYARKKEFSSKYTQKGNENEDNGIDMIAEHLDIGMLFKNEKHYENESITGTPDVVLKDLVIDLKSSWDCFTFPLLSDEIPNSDYDWQLQGYMELTGTTKAKLIYALTDTPLHLIEKEAYFYAKNNGYDTLEIESEIYEKFAKQMTYPDIPNRYRIKVYDIAYDAAKVSQIYSRVAECRKHIETLTAKIK